MLLLSLSLTTINIHSYYQSPKSTNISTPHTPPHHPPQPILLLGPAMAPGALRLHQRHAGVARRLGCLDQEGHQPRVAGRRGRRGSGRFGAAGGAPTTWQGGVGRPLVLFLGRGKHPKNAKFGDLMRFDV